MESSIILKTERLILRELQEEDMSDLCTLLQDKEVMYAYEHAFTTDEVTRWLHNQLRRYQEDGFGLWAIIDNQTNQFIGQCGLTYQSVNGEDVVEIGYLLKKQFWKQGYAIEAARACKDYAFHKLDIKEVYSIIRTNNIASQKVAQKNGMSVKSQIVKFYYEMEMPHDVYVIQKVNTCAIID